MTLPQRWVCRRRVSKLRANAINLVEDQPFKARILKIFARLNLHNRRYNIVISGIDSMTMKTTIRKMGNSQGVLIPQSLLAQVERGGDVGEKGAIVIRKPRRAPRAGWAAARRIAAAQGDALVWPESINQADRDLRCSNRPL